MPIVTFAALAQLVEQLFCKEKVPSSSLGSGSKKKTARAYYARTSAVFHRATPSLVLIPTSSHSSFVRKFFANHRAR